jgi:GntR family transcriptional regulator
VNADATPSRGHARRGQERARQALLELLERPDFGPGERLPAERDLALQLGVSRMTLRGALGLLLADGRLERRGNRGTFVARPVVERPLNQQFEDGVGQIVAHGGAAPGSRLLYFEQASASVRLSALLNVPVGAPLLAIKRLRSADGVPFCLETSYLPAVLVPDLAAADLIEGGSLYRLLAVRYAIHVHTDEGTVGVQPMTDDESRLLDAPAGTVALVYKGLIFDRQGRPVEYLVSVNHPQHVVFKLNNLRRPLPQGAD